MRYSRAGIVAVLAAAEVFIGGAILWSLGRGSFSVHAAALPHTANWSGEKTFAAIDAGSTPHVLVNDPESRVVISASSDGKVHVADRSRMTGWYLGTNTPRALQVQRTGDGVSILRPAAEGGTPLEIIGFSQQRVEVQVPPGAYLDVQRCAGADLAGLRGRIAVYSVDGSLHLDDINTPSIDAYTRDGSIRGEGLQAGGGSLRSGDGRVRVSLAGDVTVRASTADGSIYLNGHRAASGDGGSQAEFQIGKGGGPLTISTQDGSIHVTSNGAL